MTNLTFSPNGKYGLTICVSKLPDVFPFNFLIMDMDSREGHIYESNLSQEVQSHPENDENKENGTKREIYIDAYWLNDSRACLVTVETDTNDIRQYSLLVNHKEKSVECHKIKIHRTVNNECHLAVRMPPWTRSGASIEIMGEKYYAVSLISCVVLLSYDPNGRGSFHGTELLFPSYIEGSCNVYRVNLTPLCMGSMVYFPLCERTDDSKYMWRFITNKLVAIDFEKLECDRTVGYNVIEVSEESEAISIVDFRAFPQNIDCFIDGVVGYWCNENYIVMYERPLVTLENPKANGYKKVFVLDIQKKQLRPLSALLERFSFITIHDDKLTAWTFHERKFSASNLGCTEIAHVPTLFPSRRFTEFISEIDDDADFRIPQHFRNQALAPQL